MPLDRYYNQIFVISILFTFLYGNFATAKATEIFGGVIGSLVWLAFVVPGMSFFYLVSKDYHSLKAGR